MQDNTRCSDAGLAQHCHSRRKRGPGGVPEAGAAPGLGQLPRAHEPDRLPLELVVRGVRGQHPRARLPPQHGLRGEPRRRLHAVVVLRHGPPHHELRRGLDLPRRPGRVGLPLRSGEPHPHPQRLQCLPGEHDRLGCGGRGRRRRGPELHGARGARRRRAVPPAAPARERPPPHRGGRHVRDRVLPDDAEDPGLPERQRVNPGRDQCRVQRVPGPLGPCGRIPVGQRQSRVPHVHGPQGPEAAGAAAAAAARRRGGAGPGARGRVRRGRRLQPPVPRLRRGPLRPVAAAFALAGALAELHAGAGLPVAGAATLSGAGARGGGGPDPAPR
mmetsp:Transcript_72013/g.210969  ORF Transcript_72013/g.210969 Transcript_72013/m.210969 type:complete len:329 (+) Transcript_72013:1429-2415(+)